MAIAEIAKSKSFCASPHDGRLVKKISYSTYCRLYANFQIIILCFTKILKLCKSNFTLIALHFCTTKCLLNIYLNNKKLNKHVKISTVLPITLYETAY